MGMRLTRFIFHTTSNRKTLKRRHQMKYTKLGKSNLTVSRVCLGTMHFGNRTTETEAFAIMDRALEIGINFFDTANVYGGVDNFGGPRIRFSRWKPQVFQIGWKLK